MITIVNRLEEANCITHSGTMHADEIFTTAFLELYLGDIKVFRTSDVDSTSVPSDVFIYDIAEQEKCTACNRKRDFRSCQPYQAGGAGA
mgnify:CR=1 FL=1